MPEGQFCVPHTFPESFLFNFVLNEKIYGPAEHGSPNQSHTVQCIEESEFTLGAALIGDSSTAIFPISIPAGQTIVLGFAVFLLVDLLQWLFCLGNHVDHMC